MEKGFCSPYTHDRIGPLLPTMTKHLHNQFLWRFLACVWLLVISVLSVIRIAQPLDFDHSDKWTHWAAWMLMMVWFGSSWPSAKLRCFMFLLAASTALELMQDLLPWRFMDVNDLVANLAGLLTGAVLLLTQVRGLLPWFDRVLANHFDAPLV